LDEEEMIVMEGKLNTPLPSESSADVPPQSTQAADEENARHEL
jgi:hypothetical protein